MAIAPTVNMTDALITPSANLPSANFFALKQLCNAHSHAVDKLIYAQRLSDNCADRKAQNKAHRIRRADYALHADRQNNKSHRRHKAIDKLVVYL